MHNVNGEDLIIHMIDYISNQSGLITGIKRETLGISLMRTGRTYDRQRRTSASMESNTLCNRRICIGEYLNSEIV